MAAYDSPMSALEPSTKREKRIAARARSKATASARRRAEARKIPQMLFQTGGAAVGGMFFRGSNVKGIPTGVAVDVGVTVAGAAFGIALPAIVQDMARGWALGDVYAYAASRPDAQNVLPW